MTPELHVWPDGLEERFDHPEDCGPATRAEFEAGLGWQYPGDVSKENRDD